MKKALEEREGGATQCALLEKSIYGFFHAGSNSVAILAPSLKKALSFWAVEWNSFFFFCNLEPDVFSIVRSDVFSRACVLRRLCCLTLWVLVSRACARERSCVR